ncbi:MAG: chemotaxis protein CheD, partial [Pseudomonadota bacterium]
MSAQQIHIVQGEHAVGAHADTVISTLLGSCVACCLWDETAGVGGMNHMLLAAGRVQSA